MSEKEKELKERLEVIDLDLEILRKDEIHQRIKKLNKEKEQIQYLIWFGELDIINTCYRMGNVYYKILDVIDGDNVEVQYIIKRNDNDLAIGRKYMERKGFSQSKYLIEIESDIYNEIFDYVYKKAVKNNE